MSEPQGSSSLSLTLLWSIEAVRLREVQWGPLADEAELRRARSAHLPLSQAVAMRAELLSQRLGWAQQQQSFWRYVRLMVGVGVVVALLIGVGAAQAALGSGGAPVNLVRAVFVLLGLPTLGLLFWLFSFLLRWGRPSSVADLAPVWRWVARKLARGPDAILLLQALFNVVRQQRLGFWWASIGHHGFWVVALVAAWLSLWGLLAFKRYFFQWETTLLTPEQFIHWVQWASSGLQLIGLSVPDPGVIRQSDGLSALDSQGQASWAGWLLGCVGLYGLLPRILAIGISGLGWRFRQRQIHLDLQLPGLSELRPRFALSSQTLGVDKPASSDQVPLRAVAAAQGLQRSKGTWVIGMELDPQWQPTAKLPEHWHWYGVVDSRAERQQLLQQLQAQNITQLLLVCDGQQTPDRGLMAWLVEVAGYTQQTLVLVNQGLSLSADALQAAWATRLDAAALPMVYGDLSAVLECLDD